MGEVNLAKGNLDWKEVSEVSGVEVLCMVPDLEAVPRPICTHRRKTGFPSVQKSTRAGYKYKSLQQHFLSFATILFPTPPIRQLSTAALL